MNPFDQNLGYIDEYGELNGLGSKLKKALKKVEKSVKKVTVDQLPGKLRKELSNAAQNKVVRAVGGIALATFGGPAIYAALNGGSVSAAVSAAAGKTFTAKGLATIAAKEVGKNVVSKEVGKQIEKKLISDAKKAAASASRTPTAKSYTFTPPAVPVMPIARNDDALNSAAAAVKAQFDSLINDKEFINTAKTMQAQGKSAQEIAATWKNSKAYKDLAATAAQRVTAPLIYEQVVQAGAPASVANPASEIVAFTAAKNEAEKQGTDWGKLLLIAAPLALATMG